MEPIDMMNRNFLRRIAFRWAVLFVGSFIVTLPFPYRLLPDIGGFMGPFTEGLVRWTADHLLHRGGDYTSRIVSDSTGMYIHAGILLLISLPLGVVWSIVDGGKEDRRLRRLVRSAIGYYLALQLFKYGLDKLFKHQFYLPEPNTLFTSVGYLSRDILYWSTIGSSYSYNVCTGLLEIVPAMLLLFRRTRTIGAIVAAAVLSHVVLINFSFDISVKLYSSFLLLIALIIAWPGLRAMVDLFLLGRSAREEPWRPAFSSKKVSVACAAGRCVLIALILAEGLGGYVANNNFNDDRAPRPFLHGAYAVESYTAKDGSLPEFPGGRGLRRMFIHRRGYLIAQFAGDTMRDFHLTYDLPHHSLILDDGRSAIATLRYQLSERDSMLTLSGVIRGDSATIRARRIDLDRLPLMEPSFHWTIDDYR